MNCTGDYGFCNPRKKKAKGYPDPRKRPEHPAMKKGSKR